jgi:hypothetical protein
MIVPGVGGVVGGDVGGMVTGGRVDVVVLVDVELVDELELVVLRSVSIERVSSPSPPERARVIPTMARPATKAPAMRAGACSLRIGTGETLVG